MIRSYLVAVLWHLWLFKVADLSVPEYDFIPYFAAFYLFKGPGYTS